MTQFTESLRIPMQTPAIGFIGGGNMARCLIGGMLSNSWPAATLHVADPLPEQCDLIHALDPAVHCSRDNRAVVEAAEVLVLAVKPQVMQSVAREIAPVVQVRRPLVISIAAGIRSADLARWLGGDLPLVRCMPNTPALVQTGATALFANAVASAEHRALAERMMRSVGITLWVDDEAQMDAVTALSGSGPAYVFLVIEAMQEAGERLGLPAQTARLLALQTVFGAAKLALESDDPADVLRARVTSKGGTTERALQVFEEGGLRTLFGRAMGAAADRAAELAEQLGSDSV